MRVKLITGAIIAAIAGATTVANLSHKEYIAVHCSATTQGATWEGIQKYWKNVNHWENPGYHYGIDTAGKITHLFDLEKASNGVKGWNSITVNVCYIGGIDKSGKPKDTRTDKQKIALKTLLIQLKRMMPDAEIKGHRDFPNVKKACPSFNARAEYENLSYE